MKEGPSSPVKQFNKTVGDLIGSLASYNLYKKKQFKINWPSSGRVHLLGLGKSACADLEDFLKYSQEKSSSAFELGELFVFTQEGYLNKNTNQLTKHHWSGDHPVPSERNLQNSRELLAQLAALPSQDSLLVFLSGGTSALLELPKVGHSLEEIQQLNRKLLSSEVDIYQMNRQRAELSQLKNGGLLEYFKGNWIATIISSDLPGDDPTWVGSSPTIKQGALDNPEVFTLRSYRDLIEQLKLFFPRYEVFEQPHRGSSAELITLFKENLDKYKNIIVVGEANVATTGAGRGGRCSHFVASMAAELLQRGNLPDFQLAAVATDGVDGYSGSAGAFASSQQLACDLKGLRASLAQFNSGEYLNDRGLTLRKAATGINLMDFYLLSSMD